MMSRVASNICELEAHRNLKEVKIHVKPNCAVFSHTHHVFIKSQEDFATVSNNVLTLLQINITPNAIIEDEGVCFSTRVVSTASNYLCLVYRGGCFNQIMSESKVIENTSLTPRRELVSHMMENRFLSHVIIFFHI